MSNIKKLGIGIVAFEGIEHIKNIAYEIRNLSDYIVICLQKFSYHGDPISSESIKYAEELKEKNLIDEIIWFDENNKYVDKNQSAARYIETDKRNFILEHLEKEINCSHSLIIDSDEFYDYNEFKKAKQIIDKNNNIHITYCQYINYYRDYLHVLVWPMISYVPFISESKYRFNFDNNDFNKASDLSRRYSFGNDKIDNFIFDWNDIKMHHFSWIRKDISKKIEAWSANKYFSNISNLKEVILKRFFNYKDGQNAIIMFNVPNFQVIVNKLKRQYIFPHYMLDEIPIKNLFKK